ncbi:hypothetical protein JCM10213_007834 [Rhodosporidiobolus nylandii]
MLALAPLLLLLAPWLVHAAPTSSRNVTDSPSSKTSSAVSTTKASSTALGPVATLPSATSAAGFSTATAKVLAKALPGYIYNLTMENQATRISICNQTTTYCLSAGCSKNNSQVTKNFCNPETMGWNCGCDKGADSLLQPVVVPVNSYDCRLRTSACLDACGTPASSASAAVNATKSCQQACNYVLGSTCGTSDQVIPEYQVKKWGSKPKYYADTSKGGVAMGITSSSHPAAVPSLLAAALSMLGSGLLLLR